LSGRGCSTASVKDVGLSTENGDITGVPKSVDLPPAITLGKRAISSLRVAII